MVHKAPGGHPDLAKHQGDTQIWPSTRQTSRFGKTPGRHPDLAKHQGDIQIWLTRSRNNRLFILLIQVGYLGFDATPTSLPQWPTLLFPLISIMYIHITPNTIFYYSHTFFLMVYTFSDMYTTVCLPLYHNPIYCWALLIYNYFNLIPMPLYHSHTWLSYETQNHPPRPQ